MATVQTRTTKKGVKSYRIGYYNDDGKFKHTPTMANHADAKRIKEIIETQGPDIALQILNAQQQSDSMTLADWFSKHLAIASIKATDGTIADYEKIAARTWMPRFGDMPLDAITRQDVIDFIA